EGAVLPPPHAPLPDQARRAADRARSLQRPRPDRVLARPEGEGAGFVTRFAVAVLGAGGTIAPAVVRDLAASEEVASLGLMDIDPDRARAVAERHGLGKADARGVDAR